MSGRDKVLIVDDDVSFGGMVAETLSDGGYDVTYVEGPVEALEQSRRFDAAVVDLIMPGMGGLELADKLRARDPGLQLVVLTGHGDRGAAIEAVQRGVFDFLDKSDLQLARLTRTVAEAVAKARLLRRNDELLTRLTESNGLLQALHAASVVLASAGHRDRVLESLIGAARDLTSAACVRVVTFEKASSGELLITDAVGDGAETLPGTRLAPKQGIAALSAETNTTICLEQGEAHAAYLRRCDAMPTTLPGYLCVPLSHAGSIGALVVAGRQDSLSADQEKALAGLARIAAVALENARQRESADNFFTHVSDILVSCLESVEVLYRGHARGVAAMADMMTRRLGMATAERRDVHYAALLHDIGKLRLPRQLLADGPLSEEGRKLMAQHATLGVEMLRPIEAWEGLLPIILGHHERWDGHGYPSGLAGQEIPMGARVIAVADAFDAMTRDRPHAARRTTEESLRELEAHSGTQFDPRLVRLLVAEFRQHGDPRPESTGAL